MAQLLLLLIALPGTKADWLGSAVEFITFCNLLVITLEMILQSVVQHEIGLYSPTFDGLSTLGISVTAVQFIGGYILPELKNCKTA